MIIDWMKLKTWKLPKCEMTKHKDERDDKENSQHSITDI